MKKMFLAIVVAGVFASCANSGDAEQQLKDSIDSVKNLKVESVQDAANNAIDTIEQRHDSLKERVDSIGGAVRDSLNNNQ